MLRLSTYREWSITEIAEIMTVCLGGSTHQAGKTYLTHAPPERNFQQQPTQSSVHPNEFRLVWKKKKFSGHWMMDSFPLTQHSSQMHWNPKSDGLCTAVMPRPVDEVNPNQVDSIDLQAPRFNKNFQLRLVHAVLPVDSTWICFQVHGHVLRTK